MKQVWVFAEQQAGQWTSVTVELLLAAREIADQLKGEVSALVCGDRVEELAASLKAWEVDRVYLSEHPELSFYHPLVFTETVVSLVEKYGTPEMLLFGGTYLGRDLAPAVAARLGTGCAADCCDLKLDEKGNLLQIVPGLGGTIFATIVTPFYRPQIATVKPGMLEVSPRQDRGVTADADKPMQVIKVEPRFPENTAAVQIHAVKPKTVKESGLETAQRIVAGGAGIGGAEGWALLEDLADALGAAAGATRPAVDEGWADNEIMIGQSGKTVHPELYVGVGISGDMMHTIGLKGKGTRVAINQDAKAAIFKQVDYGLVADYRSILPVLIEEIKRRERPV